MAAIVLPGEKHYTVTVFLLTDEGSDRQKALLLDHPKLGVWMPPGGHQEPFENAVETAIREVREETGIDIMPYLLCRGSYGRGILRLPPPAQMIEVAIPPYGDTPGHFHLDISYVVRAPELPARPDAGETDDIGWFTLEEILDMRMFENVRDIFISEMRP